MQAFLQRLLAFLFLPALSTALLAAEAPPNDDFANAIIVTGVDVVVSGSNVDATLEPGERPSDGSSLHSVWWIWTPPVSGIIEVDTEGSSFDTVLAAYFGSRLSQLTLVAIDDDGGPDFTSRVRFSTTGGVPIALRVAGYGGATGAIRLHVRADTGVKIVGQPADQLVAASGSARFAVGATGPAPLSYQWLQDGVEIPGATAPVLILNEVTQAQAGRYQAVVRNGFASALSREARLTVTASALVVLFHDPQVVDIVNPAPDGEALNFRSNLEALGHDVIPLANLESSLVLQPGMVVALPKLEFNAPPPSLGPLLSLFVGNGGTVVVSDSWGWLPLLNSAFSWNLFNTSPFSSGLITDEVSGTPFEGGPELLPLNWTYTALANHSLPEGSRRIYDSEGSSLVVVLPYGAGHVVWLGWDWYDGAPRGGQDGGWSRVLAAAVELGRTAGDLELAPLIVKPPGPRTLFSGETLELSVFAFGSQPLTFQWFRNSEPISEATSAILRITNITTDLAGSYAVRVSNDRGSTHSTPAEVRVLDSVGLDFRIQSLGSVGQVVDKDAITGDDRGGIAISRARVFATGDSGTGHFDAGTLSGGVSIGTLYDGLVSELGLERAYVLANADGPTTEAGGVVDRLIRLHDETGALTTEVVLLSRPVTLFGWAAGIYSGVGRCVLRNGSDGATWDILIPSGEVRELPATQVPDAVWAENWAHWGLVESYDGYLHLVYVAHGNQVVRRTVGAAESTVIAQFGNLSDMASITASPRRGRWYFQYEGGAQFGGLWETLGYAEGHFVIGSPNSPPTILTPPVGGLFPVGASATLSVTAFPAETAQFRWFRNGKPVVGVTRPQLELTPLEITATGAYWVEVSNEFGRVTSEPVILRVAASPTGVTYLRSQAGRPWNNLENETALNAVFAPGSSSKGWNEAFFETADVPAMLAGSYFLFADGSHAHTAALSAFLATHRASLERWVENGGSLFLNCAPFEFSNVELGFGGVQLVPVPSGISAGDAVREHPVLSGPIGPAGWYWTGALFAHAGLVGDQLTPLIVGDGHVILAERSWGSGTVLFGSMTTPNYHSPYPAAANLRANLLAYGASRSIAGSLSPEFVYLATEPSNLLRAYLSVDSRHRYRVESSPDLRTWTPVYENASAESGALRVDLPVGGALVRYLRAVELAD